MYEPRRYAEWLHSEVFLPVVVVIGSDAAKARVKEANGLSLAELFAPFGGHFRGISVSAQSLERQIPIENLRVRYVDADLAVQLSTLQADQVAAWTVESSALAGRPDSLEAPSPWYEQWRNALFGALRWSEHEALDQPAAAMLVVLSKEPDPVMQLEQLLHASKMPPLCTQGVLDPVPSRVAVLLHDLSDPESPSKEDFDKNLASIRARFAPNLVLPLHINHGDAQASDARYHAAPCWVSRCWLQLPGKAMCSWRQEVGGGCGSLFDHVAAAEAKFTMPEAEAMACKQ